MLWCFLGWSASIEYDIAKFVFILKSKKGQQSGFTSCLGQGRWKENILIDFSFMIYIQKAHIWNLIRVNGAIQIEIQPTWLWLATHQVAISGFFFWCMIVWAYFSSPEPKAHGSANSIPMTLASIRRPSTFSNIFFSETTGSFKLKFHI